MPAHCKDIRTAQNGVELQHRHFAFIAATLKESKPLSILGIEQVRQWRDTVRTFANECRKTNPRFNRERFLSACGFDE